MQTIFKQVARFRFSSQNITVELPPYSVHLFEQNILPQKTQTNKDELLQYFKSMTVQRTMEVACDGLYKERLIRGFLHLADGQESVYEGLNAATTFEDNIITAYRDHCIAYLRGDTPHQIIAEMMGKRSGSTQGKGGSMHYYRKKNNFYGGHGIVGAQIPLGTGLAFAQKYLNKPDITFVLFGDGAANQGQVYEAANMAKLWNLPAVYLIENNLYGMGTSIERASANPLFYKRGDVIPGIQIDGNNIFAVRETARFLKQYCPINGPVFLEVKTYRYHGHSMSDPGITYRTREQVQQHRKEKDCIRYVEKLILENKFATEEELENIQEKIKTDIEADIAKAKADPFPGTNDLTTDVYVNNKDHYIRGIEYNEGVFPNGVKY